MPSISELRESRFLTKEDCGDGILVTITKVTEENVAKEGVTPEMKWCLHFHEIEKPLVLKSTNGQIIAGITGNEEMLDWPGTKIVLYNDPTITFGGKLVGGIRVRKPSTNGQAATPPQASVAPTAPQAMREAWQAFQQAKPGLSTEAIATDWKSAIAAYFPGKAKEEINALQWKQFAKDGFKKPVQDLDGPPEFTIDSIPF
jgi:hypothetical protein